MWKSIKERTEEFLKAPEVKRLGYYEGDTTGLKEASLSFCRGWLGVKDFVICDGGLVVHGTMNEFKQYGYEIWPSFFWAAEQYPGISINLYDAPDVEEFYQIQKIKGSEMAVFTVKYLYYYYCTEETCPVKYRALICLPETIRRYKESVRNAYSDRVMRLQKSRLASEVKEALETDFGLAEEMSSFLYDLQNYNMFRADPWLQETPLPLLSLSFFFSEEEIRQMKQLLGVEDLEHFSEDVATRIKKEEEE